MLELPVRAVQASITLRCQHCFCWGTYHIISPSKDVRKSVMWTADTGMAAFVFMGYMINFFKRESGKEKEKNLSF